ncbi:MAG: MATE family efflux transporter, partial [Firmicutes bacterium]|nr:MATE family efflux transporter [Bacillota bacterium]
MTEGTIWQQLLQFSVPTAIGLLFQQLYNTVDSMIVGRFVGKAALAAVGGTTPIINMLVGLCAGVATGAGVVISQSYGAKDNERLHKAVHTTILLTLIMSIVATIGGIFLVSPMLTFMKTPLDVFAEAQEYLTIYFAGIVGLLIYNMGSGILRAVGDSKRPLYFLCFSASLNVVLDLLFVLVFKWGIAGAGYATVLAQFISAMLILRTLTKTKEPYGIQWKDLALDRMMMRRIFAIGMPAGIQQAITSFSNVFVQSYINAFGGDCMAGFSSYNKLDGFLLVPVQAIAMAATTFISQNYGAGKYDRARKGVRQSLFMSLGITGVLAALQLTFADTLLLLFNDPSETEVLYYGKEFITWISPFYLIIC